MIRSLTIAAMVMLLLPAGGAGQTSADAVAALRAGELPQFQRQVEQRLMELLARPSDRAEITRLAVLRGFARSFAAADLSPREQEAAVWLAGHPVLGPLFFTTLTEQDDARRALAVLAGLRESAGQRVERWPELAVAAALVWDAPAREGQNEADCIAAAISIFDHLTTGPLAQRNEARALPAPILIYLVNSSVTPQERAWAVGGYTLPGAPGQAYFQVQYDHRGFASGQWRGDGQHPYTLPNIRRLGGVCMDQAYFASEVIRANGIPAALCTGQTSRGGGFHAWVGYLVNINGRWEWDFKTGRYREHGYWVGTVIDPQTGERLTDGDVSMLAEWTRTAPQDRLFSQALAKSLDLAEPARRLELAATAVRLAPGNRRAWLALAEICSAPDTPRQTLAEVAEVVDSFAVGRYDDFAFHMFTRLIAARPPSEQIGILERARSKFPSRPDLQLELQLAQADALHRGGNTAEALRRYERLLQQSREYGPLVMEVMERLDSLLREAGRGDQLLGAYRTAWEGMLPPDPSGYISITPWYILGERYANLLDRSGRRYDGDLVRQQLARRNTAVR